jgi:hypothetical protein
MIDAAGALGWELEGVFEVQIEQLGLEKIRGRRTCGYIYDEELTSGDWIILAWEFV